MRVGVRSRRMRTRVALRRVVLRGAIGCCKSSVSFVTSIALFNLQSRIIMTKLVSNRISLRLSVRQLCPSRVVAASYALRTET